MMLLQILFIVGVTLTTSAPMTDETSIARIVNGYEVSIEEIPYQVSLKRKVSAGLSHFCGAVILKNRVIITAAHCVDSYVLDPSSIRAVVGTVSRMSGGTAYDISKIIIHELYSSSTLVNDIALLGTAKVISFSQNVAPVNWAPHNFEIPDGTEAMVSGFGITSHQGPPSSLLLAAKVKIVNQNKCLQAYLRITTIAPEMICASASEPPRDACQGDSGGPLVTNNVLIGIVSWGEGCADQNYPGVYTRLSHYGEWIGKKIGVLY